MQPHWPLLIFVLTLKWSPGKATCRGAALKMLALLQEVGVTELTSWQELQSPLRRCDENLATSRMYVEADMRCREETLIHRGGHGSKNWGSGSTEDSVITEKDYFYPSLLSQHPRNSILTIFPACSIRTGV